MVVLVAAGAGRHLRPDGLAASLRPGLSAVRPGAGQPRGLSRAPTPSCRASSASWPAPGSSTARPSSTAATISVAVRSDEPIDPRVLRYFERSDLFSNPQLDLAEDELSGTLTVHVQRLHFFFGTDAIGRDLAARIMIGVRISLAIGILASVDGAGARRQLRRDLGLSRRPGRQRDDAHRRHPLLAALHLLRDPDGGVLRPEPRHHLHRHRLHRMARHGAHRARPDPAA